MRGHGESGSRGDIAYIGQLEDDLDDFMKQVLEVEKGVTLIGFSGGGGFALRFAGATGKICLSATFCSRHISGTMPLPRDPIIISGLKQVFRALLVFRFLALSAKNCLATCLFLLLLLTQKIPNIKPRVTHTDSVVTLARITIINQI